jgi:hypothetical protein
MKVVESSSYSGWNDYPVYRVRSFQDWLDLIGWMKENHVEHFLLSSGYGGYVFQVKTNAEWFALRWS